MRQPFLHGPLHAHEAGAELVFRQFANRTHAAITKVIDIVDFTLAVAQFHQNLDRGNDIFGRQGRRPRQFGATDTAVEFHPSHGRQVVAIFREK